MTRRTLRGLDETAHQQPPHPRDDPRKTVHAWRWSWRRWRRECQVDGRRDCPLAHQTRRELDEGEVWDV